MDFWKLFIVALMPVLKLLLITSVGTFLALNRFDILSENARKHLNTLVFFVFSPALVSSSLTKTITLRSMVMLWFLSVNVLLTYIFGTTLGWLLNKIIRVPHHLQGLVLGCCAAENLGNLLLIVVPAVCKESSNPFGDVDVCHKNGLAYASMSLAMRHICFWYHVYNIVRIYSRKNSNVDKVDDCTVNSVSATGTDVGTFSKCSKGSLVTAEGRSQTNDDVDQLEIEYTVPNEQPKVPKKAKIMKQLKILAEKINLKVLFAPASIGTIVGLVIGVVPQFREVLAGDNAPLRVVENSAIMLGDVTIPALTLILGANLFKGLKRPGKHLPIIVGIVVVRYIALPAIGIGIVKGAIHFGLIHPDPLYRFVLLLQFAVPPAVAIREITPEQNDIINHMCLTPMVLTTSQAQILTPKMFHHTVSVSPVASY